MYLAHVFTIAVNVVCFRMHLGNEVVDKTINPMLSKQLDDVVDCYEHALLAYFPRGRYLAGKDAKLVWWPLSNMPEWFVDFFFNLDPRKPKPKSCQK